MIKLQTKLIQDKIFKAKKPSKIECNGQILIPAFALFLTSIKFYFLKEDCTALCLYPILRFFWNFLSFLDLKDCYCYFLFFHQMIALQKLWKSLLFHLKSSFRSWDIQFFVFPFSRLFLPVSHCFRKWLKINLKVYDVISCLNKSLITNFVWYLEKEKGMTLKFNHRKSVK